MNNILITGCSRGLGSIIKNKLESSNKCKVFPHFRTYFGLTESASNNFPVLVGDITNSETLGNLESFLEKHDINVFVNNAAIHSRKNFIEYSDAEIDEMINVNVTSQIKFLKRVYDHFLRKGTGLIINVNSIAGIQPAPQESIYSATKHALKGFSQSLQIESIGKNIQIIDIFPGAMKTDMTKSRDNYETLIDPNEVSDRIYSIVNSGYKSSLETEIVIRKFNKR